MSQFVDPTVSREKFKDQIAAFRRIETDLGKRGCWIVHADFPQVVALFATPRLKPPALVFGAIIDFTNYDMWAPSVRLVDPFTREPYVFGRLPTQLNRLVSTSNPGQRTLQPLMQAASPDEIPFFCIPGVREYHEHPGHSGDSWLLHRNNGEGTLFFLLEQLLKYGIDPLRGYEMGLQISISGFNQAMAPE